MMKDEMKDEKEKQEIKREFGLTSFSINNSTSVFLLATIITLFGLFSYITMPKAQFPDIVLPTVYVNTIYPGNSPVDIENLVTRHLEKELKSVKGIKKIESTSAQDVSAIVVEFNEDVEIAKAIQDTKDAVDKAKKELPSDLDNDPQVIEMDFSEVPVMSVNLSGDFEINKLKEYAEYLEDEFEALSEISKVKISGALDREIQINADIYQMEARKITFNDIQQAIAGENTTLSGGEMRTENGFRRSIRISGEFTNVEQMRNIIIKSELEQPIYLKDVAQVKDSYVERDSYARLASGENFDTKGSFPVVSVEVIKKGGENLIDADEKIRQILEEAQGTILPAGLNIIITNNQADQMKMNIDNLENSIISGVILVVLVLLFFMGLRNALFVGLAIPLSMFLSFLVMGAMDVTINMVILFGLILALGMLVDNAIVVIENMYRLMEEGYSVMRAAKEGAGEVAIAIITSTLTTLAAFVPLAFWGGIMGEFMKFLPITLIIVLSSSLFVGLVINPVVAKAFMKVDDGNVNRNKKPILVSALVAIALSIPLYAMNLASETPNFGAANLLMLFGILGLSNLFILRPSGYWFQNILLPRIEKIYLKTLKYALKGFRPYLFFMGTFFFMIFSIVIFGINAPLVALFPQTDPEYVYLYVENPLGTDIETTNKMTKELEAKVYQTILPFKKIIKSVVTNVGKNTGNPNEGFGANITPHKSRISLSFIEEQYRDGLKTKDVMVALTELADDFPGVKIVVDKNNDGPPVGKPISIEVTGEDYIKLIEEADKIQKMIDKAKIAGVTGLKMELENGKPELMFNIDRAKARRYGLSTSQLGMALRTAIYGLEISKFKDKDEDYPIQLRLADKYRYNLTSLLDQRVTFRDNRGNFHQVPISAIATLEYSSSFGSVKRKDLEKMIIVSANIIEGYNANEIVAQVKRMLEGHRMSSGYAYRFGGEQEEQAKSMAFLGRAMLIAVCAIFLILVSQFNSITKPFIIVMSILFSTIGVFLGLTIFRMDFIIIMTGIGIISLAGVVVNNAIVLIDYTELTQRRKREELGLSKNESLSPEVLRECLIEAGYTRLRPVLLTAITTVLGLIPLATGFNIDFFGLFAHFEPAIFIGGKNEAFWGPMAWTVIFGLVFATFLTLVIVPVMYFMDEMFALNINKFTQKISGKTETVLIGEKEE